MVLRHVLSWPKLSHRAKMGLLVASEHVHKVYPISSGFFFRLDHMGPSLKNQNITNRASSCFFYIEFIQQEYIEQKINIISQIGFVQHNCNIHTSILLFPTLLIVFSFIPPHSHILSFIHSFLLHILTIINKYRYSIIKMNEMCNVYVTILQHTFYETGTIKYMEK